MPRFFTKNINGNTAVIEGEDVSHISRVLRMGEGEELTLCDGEGADYICKITEITKKNITCEVVEKCENQSEPACKVTLFQALPKGAKMEYIIQKCVEIGVCEIVPMMTRRVIGKPSDKGERWNKVSEEAAKQSGRGIIPRVLPAVSFSEALSKMKECDLAVMPYECEQETHLSDVLRGQSPKTVGIMIGPEGGFAPEEVEAVQGEGIKTVTLGKRILRTETAGMSVVSSIMYEYKC